MEWTNSQGKRSMIAGLGFLIVLGVGPLASAEVECGSIIRPNQAVVLTEDLTCPGSDPALTVKGPAVLRMNGKTISCAGSGFNGIEVIGKQAVIQGPGTVKRCNEGVLIAGKGLHIITGLKALRNDNDGFDTEEGSDHNTLTYNTASRNGSNGIQISSDGNEVNHNTGKNNGSDGFDTSSGVSRNVFKDNFAEGNETNGFDLDGETTSEKNEFSDNVAIANDNDGFDLDGKKTKVVGNTAKNNGDTDDPEDDEGFDIDGDDNEVVGNVSERNVAEGFQIQSGSRYNIVGNTANKNGREGIRLLEDALNSTIVRNFAKNNTLDDLADENFVPPCDNNRWLANIFITKNQACVR